MSDDKQVLVITLIYDKILASLNETSATMVDENYDEFEEFDDYKSKTQIKREAEALKKLGKEIIELSSQQRETLPLPDTLIEAIALAEKIKNKHEAHRRQIQYIGKLLRGLEVEPIVNALNKIRYASQSETKALHKLEATRDQLIAEGDNAINALIAEYSEFERSKLRQLVRKAKTEQDKQLPPKAYRELFKYLKTIML